MPRGAPVCGLEGNPAYLSTEYEALVLAYNTYTMQMMRMEKSSEKVA